MDFSANPEGDPSIASRIRNTFEITPTATAFLLLLVSQTAKGPLYVLGI